MGTPIMFYLGRLIMIFIFGAALMVCFLKSSWGIRLNWKEHCFLITTLVFCLGRIMKFVHGMSAQENTL